MGQISLAEIFQAYVNKSYDELRAIAGKNIEALLPVFKQLAGDDYVNLLVTTILTALGSDNKLSGRELQFVCELLNFNPDDAVKTVGMTVNEPIRKLVDDAFDSINNAQAKSALFELLLCCIAIDGTINLEEQKFILRLLD